MPRRYLYRFSFIRELRYSLWEVVWSFWSLKCSDVVCSYKKIQCFSNISTESMNYFPNSFLESRPWPYQLQRLHYQRQQDLTCFLKKYFFNNYCIVILLHIFSIMYFIFQFQFKVNSNIWLEKQTRRRNEGASKQTKSET